jgi:hypothetical protein
MPELYYHEIQQKGYTHIPHVFDAGVVSQLKEMIMEEWEKNSSHSYAGLEIPSLNQGHKIIYNLQNKNIYFFQIFTKEPILRSILMNCLNDEWYKPIPKENPNFILRSLLARSSGKSAMPLHLDSFIPNIGSYISIIQAAIILENQNRENGCTLVVPGSHHFGRYATQEWMKYAIPIESQAGDVVIWDSRIWHGASGNTTSQSRWSVIATFCRWWIKQNYDITGMVPRPILDKLSDEEKSILGFCSLPPRDEFDRLDMKTGYDILKSLNDE